MRSVGRLRAAAAVIVIPAAAAVAWNGGAVRWSLAVLAWIVALAWLGAALAARRRTHHVEDHYLEVGDEGVLLVQGARRDAVAWSDVESLEVDEETLSVRLQRRSGPPVAIEPIWGGLGAYALRDRLERARDGASPAKDG